MKKVVVAVISQGDKFLLVSSKKDYGKFTGYFGPPGGHLRETEVEKDGLIREIQEELGINVNPVRKIAVTGSDFKDRETHWFECLLENPNDKIEPKTEVKEVRWFTRDEIQQNDNVFPLTKSFFKDNFS